MEWETAGVVKAGPETGKRKSYVRGSGTAQPTSASFVLHAKRRSAVDWDPSRRIGLILWIV